MSGEIADDWSVALDGTVTFFFGDVSPAALAFEDLDSGRYLNQNGHWSSGTCFLPVGAARDGAATVGAEIVRAIPPGARIGIHAPDIGRIGQVVWSPSRRLASSKPGQTPPVPPPASKPKAWPSTPVSPSLKTGARAAPEPLHSPAAAPATEVAAEPDKPERGRSLTVWLVPAALILALSLGGAAARNSTFAHSLVCEAGGALVGLRIAEAVVPCPAHSRQADAAEAARPAPSVSSAPAQPPTAATQPAQMSPLPAAPPPASAGPVQDRPDDARYGDYAKCLAGKSACGQKPCVDALASSTTGERRDEALVARREMDRACQADTDSREQATVFTEFAECMRMTANPCQQGACVDRFRAKLTTEPYAVGLDQLARAAFATCARVSEEAALLAFSQCIGQNSPCDAAKCGSKFSAADRANELVRNLLKATESAARACAGQTPAAPPPAPPRSNATPVSTPTAAPSAGRIDQLARTFLQRYYDVSSSRKASNDNLEDLFAPSVNFYGKPRARAAILEDKQKYNRVWTGRRYIIQWETVQVACTSGTDTCRVTGMFDFEFSSAASGRKSRGSSKFDFTFASLLTVPNVVAESSELVRPHN
jgi:hypothetical protein